MERRKVLDYYRFGSCNGFDCIQIRANAVILSNLIGRVCDTRNKDLPREIETHSGIEGLVELSQRGRDRLWTVQEMQDLSPYLGYAIEGILPSLVIPEEDILYWSNERKRWKHQVSFAGVTVGGKVEPVEPSEADSLRDFLSYLVSEEIREIVEAKRRANEPIDV